VLNISHLLDLRVICETGSLRKAAEVLGVTQPTLGNRIARLEDQLGAPLFDRKGGRWRPTDLALFISNRAGRLAEEALCLSRDAARLASGETGVVRIGIGQVILRLLMVGAAAPIEERSQDGGLELVTGHTAQLTASLLRRDLDIVVATEADAEAGTIRSELLFDAPIVVVVHPDHPLCTTPPADLRELVRHPFAATFLEPHYLEQLREHDIEFDSLEGRFVCADVGLLVRMVSREPRFFAAGPYAMYAPEIEAGQLSIVKFDVPFRHRVFMHTSRDAYPLPAVLRMQDLIRAAFARIRDSMGTAPGPGSGPKPVR
jgi:DNA-binding transcriptional LysR family regulator